MMMSISLYTGLTGTHRLYINGRIYSFNNDNSNNLSASFNDTFLDDFLSK